MHFQSAQHLYATSKIFTLCVVACFLSTITAFAQGFAEFEQVNATKGFHQRIIYSIAQDTMGHIWAGTEEGIVRYDSRRAHLYNKYAGIEGNIHNRTAKIYIDRKHQIWAGMEEGIFRYDPARDIFMPVRSQQATAPALVKTLLDGDDGTLWVGAFNGLWEYITEPGGQGISARRISDELNVLCLYKDAETLLIGTTTGLYALHLPTEHLRGIPLHDGEQSVAVTALSFDQDGIFVGTENNTYYKLNPRYAVVDRTSLPFRGQRDVPVTKILPDKNNHYYISTNGAGLFYVDSLGHIIRHCENDPNIPHSISSDGIYDIHMGRERILWIATYGGGLNALNLNHQNFRHLSHRMNAQNSLAHNFTRSILEDSEGKIWFGTKRGISIWDRDTDQWHQIPSLDASSREPDIVMALAEDDAYIWAGTYGRGVFRIHKRDFGTVRYHQNSPVGRRIHISKVYAVHVDQEGNCWLGGIDERLHCILSSGHIEKYPLFQVRDIIETGEGHILVAGRNGVHRIEDGKVSEMTAIGPGVNALNYTTITSLYENDDGRLLVGTNGSGLLIFDPAKMETRLIDPNHGLPSDIVQGILKASDGMFWISTSHGLVQLSIDSEAPVLKIFDEGDGFPGSVFNYGSYASFRDGSLAFGGPAGVIVFDPGNLRRQEYIPHIALEDFQVLRTTDRHEPSRISRNIKGTDTITLKHYENAFRISFVGVMHSAPEKVLYRWKMHGLNNDWSRPRDENQTNFTNLSPGTYTFSVQAANRDGVWGREKSLTIHIRPPWWATRLAFFAYIVLAIGLIIGSGYIYMALVRKRNAEEQIAFFSNITHELKTPLSVLLSNLEHSSGENGASSEKVKLTIHRLNNLFDQLLHFNLVARGGLHQANVMKIRIHTYVRQVLNSFEPLLDEKEITASVVSRLEQEVFYYDIEILNKILFNMISNAIKYSKKGGRIDITLDKTGRDTLRMQFADNGIGIPKDQQKYILKRYYRGRNVVNSQLPGTGLGLMIVKNLLEKDKGGIAFESSEKRGTTFTITLKNQAHLYQQTAIRAPSDRIPFEVRDHAKLAEYSDAKILVIEDNNDLRQHLVAELSTYFQVFEATNGREGLEKVRQLFPDLIITDLIMPEMDGIELCKRLQEDINLNHILVFMMTVLSGSETKLKSVEAGVTVFLEKPIDINFLLAKIVSTFEWQKKLHKRYQLHSEIESAEKFRNKRDAEFLNGLEKFILDKVREENLSVHDLCNYLGMSRTALYMKLKNLVDLSPQNFIIHTRLKYAKKLLIEQNLSIKEVAYRCGFSNPKYFSTSFKKKYQKSPTAFVKSLHVH